MADVDGPHRLPERNPTFGIGRSCVLWATRWFAFGVVTAFAFAIPRASNSAGFADADPASRSRPPGIEYLSPLPGTGLHPVETTIAIRPGDPFDPLTSLDPRRWMVTGSTSGVHEGKLCLSADLKTLYFQPFERFADGEHVLVAIASGLTTRAGKLAAVVWSFDVRHGNPAALQAMARRVARDAEIGSGAAGVVLDGHRSAASPALGIDTDLPVRVLASNAPDTEGGIFLAPFTSGATIGHLLVVDHRGQPLFERFLPDFAFDFRPQPNGLLTYWNEHGYYCGMDSTGTVVDTFRCGNGYLADEHELQILPNGHFLLLSYDPEFYPTDGLVPGGHSDAVVMGLIVQELDESKNVVMQWRSWDHMQVTDLVECAAHLTDPLVDYVHGNAIDADTDSTLLISSRHLNEITRINRRTGEVVWRLGLNSKNNQFTFLDDARGFAHQHDVRHLPNGHITLFDNGNCLVPTYSRALEYEIDEVHWTARLVREIRHAPDQFGAFMGNRQERADGTVTIGWGGALAGGPKVTELHADGSVALDLAFPTDDVWSYRAVRVPWRPGAFTTTESIDFGTVNVGMAAPGFISVTNHLDTPLTLNQFVSTDTAFAVVAPESLTLGPGAKGTLLVRFKASEGVQRADLYVRAVNDTGLVARVVHLTGTGVHVVAVKGGASNGALVLDPPLPNPARERVTIGYQLPRRTAVSVEVFDVHGRRVAALVEGTENAGRRSKTWSPGGRPAGVYFVRLCAEGRTLTERVTVAR